MDKKHYYIFTDSSGRGGVGVHICEIARALFRCGHDVTIIVYKVPLEYYSSLLGDQSVRIVHCSDLCEKENFFLTLRYWIKYLGGLCLRPGIAIYCRGISGTGSSAVLLAIRYHFRSVYTVEHALASLPHIAWNENDTKKLVRFKIKTNLEQLIVRHFIAVSEAARESMIRLRGYRPSKIVVCRNGVDILRYRPNSNFRLMKRHEMGIHYDDFVLGFIGRFSREKNPDIVLKGFKLLLEDGIDKMKLILFGEGPLIWPCKEFVKDKKIGSHVKFCGWKNDMEAWLPTLDLFVLPSISESLSLAVAEAMAAGVLCLCYDNVGNRQIIQDGVNGFLALLNTPEAIRHAVIKIYNLDRQYLDIIRENARRTVAIEFNQTRQIKEFLQLVEAD